MMLIFVRDNLIMRSLEKSDANKVYAVVNSNRDYLRNWLPWVDGIDSPADYENIIATWKKDCDNKNDIILGIFDCGKYVGNIGLHDLKSSNHSGMIGYWLAEDHQGRGIISDCVRALVDFAFHTLTLNRIYIHCAVDNKKSRAIPERLGFIQEGRLQDGECLYDVFHDLIIYGMVKSNWNNGDTLCLVAPSLEDKELARSPVIL